MNNVSPQEQKLHSHCHFSAEEYPEEETSPTMIQTNDMAKF